MIASVAQLSTALLLELQCTPEGCQLAVSGGELLGKVVNLVLGGEELIRHECRRFGKVVVGEGSVDRRTELTPLSGLSHWRRLFSPFQS